MQKLIFVLLGAICFAQNAQGLPAAAEGFCDIYPDSPHCESGPVNCTFCHTAAPTLNTFGNCVKDAVQGNLVADLPNALGEIEDQDCDSDSFITIDEIMSGTDPGNPNDKPKDPAQPSHPVPADSCEDRSMESEWDLCGYDPVFTFKRIHLDFCGASPTYAEWKSFKSLSKSAQMSELDQVLAKCMQTAFWRGPDGFIWKIGHEKITPLQTIKSGVDAGPIALGDYDDDYHLFVYHHIDGADVRGLLTAQYFVMREGLSYTTVNEVPLHPEAAGVVALVGSLNSDTQQFIPQDKRAGMLTTLWFAVNNTMFTSLPRTTAAQAMRSYLGLDIAKSEGLIKPNDPSFVLQDFDNKGVTDKECAFCHEVLDAASYPFTKYNGLSFNVPGNGDVDIGSVFDPESDAGINIPGFIPDFLIQAFINNSKILYPGMYKTRRMEILSEVNADTEPDLNDTPEAGFILGQPVDNLVEWAAVAANSDAFAKQVVRDYWDRIVKRPENGKFAKEFDDLWQSLKAEDQYRVDAMLRRLIKTEAYGAP